MLVLKLKLLKKVTIHPDGFKKIKEATDLAIKKGYTVIGLTASGAEAKATIKQTYGLNYESYLCDEKALKTVVRSNPGIVKLHKGTVIQKLHFNDAEDLELPEVEPKPKPVVLEKVAYFINDKSVTEEEVKTLDSSQIEKVEVLKEGKVLDSLNLLNNGAFTGLIKVTLKE